MSSVARPSDIEQSFSSTRWRWQRIMMRPERPTGQGTQPPQASERVSQSKAAVARKALRFPTPAVLRYRGGAAAWVEIEARGRKWRFDGSTALVDALKVIHGFGSTDITA